MDLWCRDCLFLCGAGEGRRPVLEGVEERIKKLGDAVPEMLLLEQVLIPKVSTFLSRAARFLCT